MEYYIEPAEQTDEVKAQLAAITPSELNPEELTLIDPACGSGHILVEAYDLFKAIYLERGYRLRGRPAADPGEESLRSRYRRPCRAAGRLCADDEGAGR